MTDEIIVKLEWLGMFSNDLKVPEGTNTALDAVCHLCQEKLVYQKGEKDMIVMRHTFDVSLFYKIENINFYKMSLYGCILLY